MNFLSIGASFHAGTSLASFTMAQQTTGQVVSTGNSILLMIIAGISAISLFAIAGVAVGIYIMVKKAQAEIMGHVVEIKNKALPLIASSHSLVTDLTPEIKKITATANEISSKVNVISGKVHEIIVHVEEMTATGKVKFNEFMPTVDAAKDTANQANQTVREANEKTRQQIDRVNGMVSSALDATEKMGRAIQHGITQPGREIAGFVNGAKASIDHVLDSTGKGINGIVGKVAAMFAGKSRTPKTGGVAIKPFGSMSSTQIPPLHEYTPKPENTPRF